MIPGILNTPELRPIQSMEESPGRISSPSTCSSAPSCPIFWPRKLGEADPRHSRGNIMVGDCGPNALHFKSSGNLPGGQDGTTKGRPSSSGLKTDCPFGITDCRNEMWQEDNCVKGISELPLRI